MYRLQLLFLLIFTSLFATDQLSNLHCYGDALNMEGGLIPKFALTKEQTWANICFVLDKPLIEQKDLDEITAENSYTLKESSILDFNEPQAVLVQSLILDYYLKSKKPQHIMVNVHRNRSGPAHLDQLERMLQLQYQPKALGDRRYQIGAHTISLCYGTILDFAERFKEADVVFSISMVAGLNQKWKSGTPVLPEQFVPFDLHSMNLVTSGKYHSQNHLLEVLPEILALQNDKLIRKVNQLFASPNPSKKKVHAKKLTLNDFMKGVIFQANGMFYPKKLAKQFEVY